MARSKSRVVPVLGLWRGGNDERWCVADSGRRRRDGCGGGGGRIVDVVGTHAAGSVGLSSNNEDAADVVGECARDGRVPWPVVEMLAELRWVIETGRG